MPADRFGEVDEALLEQFEGSELETGYDRETGKWEVIVKYNGDLSRVEEELDVEVEILSENYAIITLAISLIPVLSEYSEIEFVERPKRLTASLQESMRRACVPSVQSEAGFDLRGTGVIVAVIDSGIDYTHNDFREQDGSSRILYLWDQTGSGSPPEGFKGGAEYDSAAINLALANPQPFSVIPQMDSIGQPF